MYDRGFVFTRKGSGVMQQTRSLRIDLSKFELSSENRRILRKTDDLGLRTYNLPLANYNWKIGKMAKDFYDDKFGKDTMTANKVKEIMTDPEFRNFNVTFQYVIPTEVEGSRDIDEISRLPSVARNDVIGYTICRETPDLLHYSYPFYNLQPTTYNLHPNIGLGMMTKAIAWAKENGKKYVYLGSFQRPTDTYKLQFSGIEWFDKYNGWSDNLEELKDTLKK